jgi:glycosyltransferase involved in cell wall biosynthesis
VTYGNKAMQRDIHFWALPKKSYKYFAGVDFSLMDSNIDSLENKKKMGITGRKVVLSPRTFASNSNIDEIIKTIPLVKKIFSDVLYIFVCHLKVNNYTSEIMAQVERLNIKENCMFFGYIKPEEMANYYSVADVVISIVSSDGMPATLFEAMAMKKVLVLSDIPSYVELMDEKFALMVNQHDSHEIAEAIIRGLTQTREIDDIKKVAYDWVFKNANIQKLNTGLEKIYFEMVNNQ